MHNGDTLNEEEIFKHFGGKLQNDLNELLDCDASKTGEIDTSSISKYVNLSQFPAYISGFEYSFTVLSLNCQSINAKLDNIKIILNETLNNSKTQFSAICLQETWIAGPTPDVSHLHIPGYQTFALGATCSSHGGLLCYIHDSLNVKILNLYQPSQIWEGQFLEICSTDHQSIILSNIYRPPRNNNNNSVIESFLKEIGPIIHSIGRLTKDSIIVGDFNIDLLRIHEREKYNEFLETMVSNGFFPKITFPTRFAKKSAALLDQFFVKSVNLPSKTLSGILFSSASDHLACFSCFPGKRLSNKTKYVTVHRQDPDSVRSFIEDIATSQVLHNLNNDLLVDPNETYDLIEKVILDAKNKHLPSKVVRFNKYKHKKNPWMTSGILKSIKGRDKLYLQLKSTKPDSPLYIERKTNLSTRNSIINRLITEAKTTYYNREFQKYQSDIKNTWKVINSILNRDKNGTNFPSKIIYNKTTLTDMNRIVECLNTYFATAGESLAKNIPQSSKHFRSYLKEKITFSFNFKLTTPQEIQKTINDFKPKTSSGHNGLNMKLIKQISNHISNAISLLVNQSLTTGIFPDKFKIAKILPLMKKANSVEVDNFRPISLLNSISKILEKCVFNQVFEYFETNKLFHPSQYGYRKDHSTETACLDLTDKIRQQLDKGESPICLFLDLSKAFDTLNHSILIKKLKHYGFQNLRIFISYHRNPWG